MIDIVPPTARWPARRSAQITPATYAAQPVMSPGAVSSGMRTSPSLASLRTATGVSVVGAKVTTVRSGSAIGSAKPRL